MTDFFVKLGGSVAMLGMLWIIIVLVVGGVYFAPMHVMHPYIQWGFLAVALGMIVFTVAAMTFLWSGGKDDKSK
jgi:hypothetical protein